MRCQKCGCTLLSCQCADGPTNNLLENERPQGVATHADPARRILSPVALRNFAADGDAPKCRVCGGALKAGDYVDPHHPYEHRGNLHERCALTAPVVSSY